MRGITENNEDSETLKRAEISELASVNFLLFIYKFTFPKLKSCDTPKNDVFNCSAFKVGPKKPFKNDEKCFLFHCKSSFRSQDI